MTTLFDQVEIRAVPLALIQDDPASQPRESLDDATVERYADAMAEGQNFPPVVLYFDGTNYWLADGWHRREAARRLQRVSINAEVHPGTRRDAMLYAAGANATHGLPRSNEDKRRAVMMLLRDAEWSQWSDREIARRTQTSQPFVSGLRRELSDNGYQMPEERLFRRGGETYTQNVNTEARTASARAREAAAPGAGEIEAARQLVARALTTWTRPVNFGSIYNQVQRLDGGAHTSRRAVRVAIDRMIEARNVIELKDQYGRRVYALADDPAIRQKTPANATPAADLKQRILDLIDVSPLPALIICERLQMRDSRAEIEAALAELHREKRAHEYRGMWFAERKKQAIADQSSGQQTEAGPDDGLADDRTNDYDDANHTEPEEVPEAELQQGMAEDGAHRQQTGADAEAEPDDELADDRTDDWERDLPPTQTALDAERLLRLLPESDTISYDDLTVKSGLPKDRLIRAVNLLVADGKAKSVARQVTRLTTSDPLADIPASQRVAVLRLLHELRANTETLLHAAWDGEDYSIRAGDALGELAQAQGWIIPVSKWSSDSKWCAGYVLSDAGRAIYQALLAAHPGKVDNEPPASVRRLTMRTLGELDKLSNSTARVTRQAKLLMPLSDKLPPDQISRRITQVQEQLRDAMNALTGLYLALQE